MYTEIHPILEGVIANVLTAMLGQLSRKQTRPVSDIVALLKRAIGELSQEFAWGGTGRVEEVCLYLGSPEMEAIIRQLFAAKLTKKARSKTTDAVSREFLASLALYLAVEVSEVEVAASTYLY